MKKLMGLFLILALPLSAFAGGEQLVGTWKSNKQATLDYLKAHTMLTSGQLGKVGQSLGRMTFTFDKNNMTMTSGTWTFSSPYKVVSEAKDSITIESKDPGTQQMSQNKFFLDGNSFWVPDDRIHGYRERFDKQK